jgi:hypothetical protein
MATRAGDWTMDLEILTDLFFYLTFLKFFGH